MRLTFCVLCGQNDPTTLEHHHFIPNIWGGTDDENNMFTVCGICHGRIHNIPRPLNLSELIKEGNALKTTLTSSQYMSLAQQKLEQAEYAKKKAKDIINHTYSQTRNRSTRSFRKNRTLEEHWANDDAYKKRCDRESTYPRISKSLIWKQNNFVYVDNSIVASIVPDKDNPTLFHILIKEHIVKCYLNRVRAKDYAAWLVDRIKWGIISLEEIK